MRVATSSSSSADKKQEQVRSIWDKVDSLEEPQLKELGSKMLKDILGAKAGSTTIKYRQAFDCWENFAVAQGLCSLPASVLDFSLYLTHLSETRANLGCIMSPVYGVKWAHDCADLYSPTESNFVKNLLNAYKRRFSQPVARKEPILSEKLIDIAKEYYESSDLTIIRDVTMAILLFAGFLRFSELQNLACNDILISENDVQLYIKKSKTDQFREGSQVVISRTGSEACPWRWSKKYLAVAQIDVNSSGFLFRQIACSKGRKFLVGKKPVSYSGARSSILGRLGLYSSREYGLHSFRSGGVTAAMSNGVSLRQVKTHGRWKSDAVYSHIKSSTKDRQVLSRHLGI